MSKKAAPSSQFKPVTTPPEPITWDEERLELALKQLKLLHTKLRGLRTTIPRMVEPLTLKHESPEDLYNTFKGSVNTAIAEVRDFKQLMENEETTSILGHAAQRRREEPKGIKPWRASDHPDWMTLDT